MNNYNCVRKLFKFDILLLLEFLMKFVKFCILGRDFLLYNFVLVDFMFLVLCGSFKFFGKDRFNVLQRFCKILYFFDVGTLISFFTWNDLGELVLELL